MRYAIVGSRRYFGLDEVRAFVASLEADDVVVTGGASGVDAVAEAQARMRGLRVDVIPADWEKHGKAAGPIRNAEIVRQSDRVIAFWDGKSRGTLSSISEAIKQGRMLRVYMGAARWSGWPTT